MNERSDQTTPPLRCIFCGSTYVIVYQFSRGYAVSCERDECGAIGPEKETPEAAVEAWYEPEKQR